jgi:hypothetical protein
MIDWPMNILTRPAGESRKLLIHPNKLLSRSCMRRDSSGIMRITDPEAVKLVKRLRQDGPIKLYREVKQQGHRHFYCRDLDGHYRLYGRRLNIDEEYPDIMDKFHHNGKTLFPVLPKGTVVDCELIWPGHPDSEVPTGIKNNEALQIVAFGIPLSPVCSTINLNLSYKSGRSFLYDYLDDKFIIEEDGFIVLKENNIIEVIENLLEEAEEEDIEGWVLKEKAFSGWWKVKLVDEMDVFVTGFNISESETRYGMVTSVKIGKLKGKEIIDLGKVSGFDESEMDRMTIQYDMFEESVRNRFMRRVLRVQYQEIASKGKLKHAFFDGWRDDKNWKDCK